MIEWLAMPIKKIIPPILFLSIEAVIIGVEGKY